MTSISSSSSSSSIFIPITPCVDEVNGDYIKVVADEFINQCDLEALSLISETDKNGIPWEWYAVRDNMNKMGVKALPLIFDYYQAQNKNFDPWTNYLLSCSYFTDKELNFPCNRSDRRKLEDKVKKMMKKLPKNKRESLTMTEFLNLYKN